MWIHCPGHVGVRNSGVANHVGRNAIATGMIPMDMTDVLKLMAEELGQEKERACAHSIWSSEDEEIGG